MLLYQSICCANKKFMYLSRLSSVRAFNLDRVFAGTAGWPKSAFPQDVQGGAMKRSLINPVYNIH